MVNVSLFLGGPKGTDLGEDRGRKRGICGACPWGRGGCAGGAEQSGAGTEKAGQCPPPTAGVGRVTVGKSLSPWGLSFPEFAPRVSTVHSEQMAPIHLGKEQMAPAWAGGLEGALPRPSASPALRPLQPSPLRLPVFCLDRGSTLVLIQAPHRASKSWGWTLKSRLCLFLAL